MTTKIYKPNKVKILKDILIVGILISIATLLNSGFSLKWLIGDIIFILAIGTLYMIVVGVLPVLRVKENSDFEYRSDYGITHKISANSIKSITKGSGVGGYEHALFLKYSPNEGMEKKLKIKSSLFKREDMVDFVLRIKSKKAIETNEELEDYLAGRKTKYSWKI